MYDQYTDTPVIGSGRELRTILDRETAGSVYIIGDGQVSEALRQSQSWRWDRGSAGFGPAGSHIPRSRPQDTSVEDCGVRSGIKRITGQPGTIFHPMNDCRDLVVGPRQRLATLMGTFLQDSRAILQVVLNWLYAQEFANTLQLPNRLGNQSLVMQVMNAIRRRNLLDQTHSGASGEVIADLAGQVPICVFPRFRKGFMVRRRDRIEWVSDHMDEFLLAA